MSSEGPEREILKAFLWKGPTVLKRYSYGSVLVLATSVQAAWDKLRVDDPRAWVGLKCGCSYSSFEFDHDKHPDGAVSEYLADQYYDPKFVPPEPQEIALTDLRAVVQWGSE